MTAPLLVVQHEPECPPGWVGDWLTDAGVDLDVRRPYAGEALPADLTAHAGLVVLGGHMGADDDTGCAWLGPTKELIRHGAEAELPVLGICLGHQLAAVALGGEVSRNPTGIRRGVLDMGWLPEVTDDPVLGACGPRSVQWHRDIVTRVPSGTRELARAGTGELLAAQFAPTVWGLQCHPEARAEIVSGWAARGRSEAVVDAATEVDRIDTALAQVDAAADELRAGWRPMVLAFAALVLESSRSGALDRADGGPSAQPV